MTTTSGARRRFWLLPDNRYLGWTPYLWLVYLPTLFVSPALSGASTRVWVATISAVVVFIPLYFRAFWARGRESDAIIAAITILGAALVPLNSSGFTFFIYAASFAGTRRPTRRAVVLLAALTAAILVEALMLQLPIYAWGWAVLFVWIVGAVNTHYVNVAETNRELKMAREQIEHLATVAERERIARDLHDLLGHTLSLITIKSSLASRLADRDPARAAVEIRDVERISREALSEVRAAVAGFRNAGFAREVESARTMLKAADIQSRIEIEQIVMSPNEEAVAALAMREAVTNVVRHSRGTTCTIKFATVGGVRRLTIADDGKWKRAPEGNGLLGMRERISLLGGTMRLESDSTGSTIVIELPASGEQRDEPSRGAGLHIVA